eukprot:GHVR01014261.1.p1 GENE.GHVR01014261.1~~GHVR01014261.1.p1  ORF type:complete len:106 (+),score=10.56 GHVR01014261.1:4301-4618(+)
MSLPKTATTNNITETLISPTNNQNTNPIFTHNNLNFTEASQKNIYDHSRKIDKKVLSKQLLSQVHFCRFLYKLIMRVDSKLKEDLAKELIYLKEGMCGLIFEKLQ